MVPITSDLAGYAAFWTRVVFIAGGVVGAILVGQCWLLWQILVTLRTK